MRNQTIGQYKSIDAFVAAKLKRYEAGEKTFRQMFELMFSEPENIMFEKSEGYRIVETTYGACRDAIERRAAVLRNLLGPLPADAMVGLFMQNSRAWIELFWAILMCGWRPLLMNTRLDRTSLREIAEGCGLAAVIADEQVALGVRIVPAEQTEPGEARLAPGAFGTEILVMSSGTSAHVKVCAYGAEAFYHTLKDSCDIIRRCPQLKRHYKGRLKILAFLPFCHIFGLVAVYLWFTFFSRTLVLLNDMTPQTIVNTIRRHEVTHIFAVPLLWNRVYDQATRAIRERGEATWRRFRRGMAIAARLDGVPLLRDWFSRVAFREIRENLFGESVCFLISGGSEIRPCVLEFMNAIGYRLANGYGMTEIGITSVELSADRRVLKRGSVGKPFSSVAYRVDGDGQLLVRGPSTARYILEGGARRERGDGWFQTGDLAECRNGRYYILGRRDDVVISPNGENLNPILIESQLSVDGARGVCLVGLRDEAGAEPALVVSVQPFMPAEALRRVRDRLTERLEALGLARQVGRIVFTGEALMGEDDIKLNRGRVARRLQAGELAVIEPDRPSDGGGDALAAHIRALFAQALNRDAAQIDGGTDFFLDGGGSSLDYFSMVLRLQSEFGIAFPSDADRSLSTPAEIAAYIAREVDAHG